MVKIVLIGKSDRLHCGEPRKSVRFVGLEFILREAPGVMVNRGFQTHQGARGFFMTVMRHSGSLSGKHVLKPAVLPDVRLGSVMPVQRKVFRIEQDAQSRAPDGAAAVPSQDALRQEFMAELQALRELLEPRARVERDAMERARAQIAEAHAYKHELELIYAAVKSTREEMDAFMAGARNAQHTARAGRELTAIVNGTEQATQSILQAAEDIDQAAATLCAARKGRHDQGLAQDIRERVVRIFEACNFQDLTGQRVAKVMATLRFVEDHVARLLEIWQHIERFSPVVPDERRTSVPAGLSGPKLPGDEGHSTQDDIDALFGCA
jgi:chemotaxis protein CheZ